MNLDDILVRDPAPPDTPPPLRDPPPPHAWLDAYIAYSRQASPEAYEPFHEACGLWLLSVIAARRVHYLLADSQRYTPLFIALTSTSTEFAKSTTARAALSILKSAQLDWMLLGDTTTPENFIAKLSKTQLPDDEILKKLPASLQEKLKARLLFAGQAGWFYDEFGGLIDAMMRTNGYMAEFKSLLRIFDDCRDEYHRETRTHGIEFIREPYLSLLCSTTPADLRRHAKRGGRLWSDGFWARFAIICPPHTQSPIHATMHYSREVRSAPAAIVKPLLDWHERLGKRSHTDDPLTQTRIHFSLAIWKEYDAYRLELKQQLANTDRRQHGATDLHSSYARLPEKALRIASLLASVEGGDVIEMRHWQRALHFCKILRESAHNLYETVNAGEPTKEAQQEDRVIRAIKKGRAAEKKKGKDRWPTERDIVRIIGTAMSQAQIREHLHNLLELNVIAPIQRSARRKEYELLA